MPGVVSGKFRSEQSASDAKLVLPHSKSTGAGTGDPGDDVLNTERVRVSASSLGRVDEDDAVYIWHFEDTVTQQTREDVESQDTKCTATESKEEPAHSGRNPSNTRRDVNVFLAVLCCLLVITVVFLATALMRKSTATKNVDITIADIASTRNRDGFVFPARTWTDASGNFTTLATFVACDGDQVVLYKENETEVTLPFAKLSERDQSYVLERPVGYTALHVAASHGDTKTVRFLIGKGAKIDCIDEHGMTPLMEACCLSPEVVRLLISAGADVNFRNRSGFTPLMYAAHCGQLEIVRILLQHGARKGGRANGGAIALDFARQGGVLEIVEVLQ